jgi:succinoglycan biosynthesis transport protein ExoP
MNRMHPVASARAGTGDGLMDGGRAARIAASARAIAMIVRRQRVILFVTMALCVLAGVFYILFSTPDYRATASVEVEDVPAGAAGSSTSVRASGPTDTESLMQTQVEVLRSRALAEGVAKDLALVGSATFWQGMDASRPMEGQGSLTQRQVETERAVALLQQNLDVTLPGRSRVLAIGFTSADPVLSARIADSYAGMLIRTDLKRGFDSGVQARRFLLGELDGARGDLERAERELAVYAARFGEVVKAGDGRAPADSDSLSTRLAQLNAFRAQAVSDRIGAQKKWESARAASAATLPEVLGNGAMQTLMARRAEARAALVEARQFRKDAHPEMREARAQLAALDDQINAMADAIRASVQAQYDVAVKGEKQIDKEIATLEQEQLAGRGRDVQLGIMERQVDTYRALHDSLLQRYRDMASQAGFQAGRIQPLDRAAVPTRPTSPNIGSTMLLASLGGLLLGLLLVAARHVFDDAVRSAETLAERVDLPLLGAVPVGVEEDDHAGQETAFAPIAASLLLASVDGLPRSILVTSVQSDEGKSTSVHALATGLARMGKRVLVIDADMRRPVQHQLFRLNPVRGISEVMTGQARAEEAVLETSEPNLSLLPCGAIPPNPAELLATGALDALLAELQGRFDTLLVDAPPILGLSDAPLIGAKVQAIVLVVESGRNHHGGLRVAVDRLRRAGGTAIGAILTKQPLRSGAYDYHLGG